MAAAEGARRVRMDAATTLQCMLRRLLAIRARERARADSILATASGKTAAPPPDEVLCPITTEVMVDPVVTADGHSYERTAIESWLARGKTTSPLTGEQLAHTMLTPSYALRALCHKHLPAN